MSYSKPVSPLLASSHIQGQGNGHGHGNGVEFMFEQIMDAVHKSVSRPSHFYTLHSHSHASSNPKLQSSGQSVTNSDKLMPVSNAKFVKVSR